MEPNPVVAPNGDDRAGQTVAAALRAELGRQMLTSTDLAARLVPDRTKPRTTVDPRYVRRRILGEIPLTIDDVQWFCAALGVPMSQILEALGGDQ